MIKKILLIIILGFGLQISNAQQTYVPDDNFEQALINLGYDNVLDDYVTTANITGISSLFVGSLSISDLTGVEAMVSLTHLECDDNNLISLDLSSNTLLNWLMCQENQLTSIDVSNLSFLVDFDCSYNMIITLDVSSNTNMIALDCFDNQLILLDASNGNNLNMDFNCFNNPNLYGICADDSVWATNNWTVTVGNIDTQHYFIANCSAPPPPPSSQKTFVPDDNFESYIEGQGWGDGLINDSVFSSPLLNVTSLNVNALGISDLTGIEDFISVNQIYADNNNISFVDLSNLQYLSSLNLSFNNLTSIDLSNNPLLEYVWMGDNQIVNIDLSSQPNLYFLNIDNGIVTQLSLFSPSSVLGVVRMHSNNITNFDATQFPSLIRLDVSMNDVSNIDLTQNNNLEWLSVGSNPNLWNLDLSQNYSLDFLDVFNNALSDLDMRNGNNQNMTYFASLGCWTSQFLTCISVDDSTYSADNWTNIDTWQYFSNNCDPASNISEIANDEKQLIKIVTILGKEVVFLKVNQIYFYVYADGTVVKKLDIKL